MATACSSKTMVSQILSISADSVLDPPPVSVILIGHIPCGLSYISSLHSLQYLSEPNSVNVKMEAECSPRMSVSALILHGIKTQKFTVYYVLIDKHVMKYKGIYLFCYVICSVIRLALQLSVYIFAVIKCKGH